jgi:uncharacterized protein (TIGR02001 family)
MSKTTHYVPAILAGSALLLGLSVQPVQAESPLTANFGVTSNYIFRGVSQTGDIAAASTGIDYNHKSGAYAGLWSSSLGGGGNYELDIYGGYGGKISNIDYDIGLIFYNYPGTPNTNDFAEIYANADFDYFTLQVAFTIDKDSTTQDSDLYAAVGTELELKKGLNLGLTLGLYSFDDPAFEDYMHIQAALKKGEFTFALDKNDLSNPAGIDDLRLSASWTRSFDL